jgi:phosphonopyruvate decarboxylase
LGALLEALAADRSIPYYPAVREDAAFGLAAGAYLAGKKQAVLIQNSGLGYSLNVLTSLNLIYKIPVLILVTWRGHGPDAPEHIVMGASCLKLMEDVGISAVAPEAPELLNALRQAAHVTDVQQKPFAIFIRRGIFGQ